MKNRKLRGIAAASALAIALIPPSAPARPLIIATEEYPPFEYQENGVAKGITIDLVTQIFGKLGIRFEFRFYPFARGWMLIEKGRADAITSVSYAPDREDDLIYTAEQRDFVASGCVPRDYVWLTENVFFVSTELQKAMKFESLEQIRADRYRVGVVANYSYNPDFWKAQLDTRVFPTAPDAFQALIDGSIHVFPFDRTVGAWTLRREGLLDRVTPLPKSLFVKPYLLGFARRSDYPDMEGVRAAFYRELAEMRFSGEYDKIVARYLPASEVYRPPRPLIFTAESWPPYEWADAEGRMRGINVEVIGQIMRTLGVPFSLRIYPWSRAWMMVQKGSADAVLSVSYKESRETDLAYTDLQRIQPGGDRKPGDSLWITEYVFFVKTRDIDKLRFESLEQVKADGIRIGVNRDYTYSPEFLEAKLPSVEYSSTSAGFQGLVADEIQLYPMDRTVGHAQLRALGLSASITNLPKVIFCKPYLAVFSKHSTYPQLDTIRPAFYSELSRIRASGEYDRIRARYIQGTGE